jgi:phage host-nuclease inhibitor protein Gam
MAALSAERRYAASDTDWHIDSPLSEMSIQFYVEPSQFLAPQIIPVVPVAKQSDIYRTWDKDYWFKVPDTNRARGTRPNRVETAVSSATYYAKNYALEEFIAYEDLDNADEALALEESAARHVMQLLMLDMENRVANLLTTAANVGSGNALTGTAQWSDRANSDPVSDVTTGRLWIMKETGQSKFTMVVGQEVHDSLLLHPDMIDRVKGAQVATAGNIEAVIAPVFQVGRYFVGKTPKQNAAEGLPTSASSMTFIWGKNASLFVAADRPARNTPSGVYAFRWRPQGFTDFLVETKDDDDIKARLKRVNYFQDERITATQLTYLLSSVVA